MVGARVTGVIGGREEGRKTQEGIDVKLQQNGIY